MKLKDLIGYQLVDLNNEQLIVSKNNKEYIIEINEDGGDCCGYNAIETQLFFNKAEKKRNPIITNIKVDHEEGEDDDTCKIAFFGESKKIGLIDAYSSSGSGWQYGATVWLECKTLNINETLTQF